MVTRNGPVGRHRVADGMVAESVVERSGTEATDLQPADPVGPFAIQWLNDQWFVGFPGAAQRIEDSAWLDAWLAANGALGREELDFAGDRELEQRFVTDLGPIR